MEEICCRVLFVSDDPAAGPLWAGFLRASGAIVTLAATPDEALVLWDDDPPDITVIDDLSGLDELEVCRLLRARSVNPILLLSNSSEEPSHLDIYRAGADECIQKSVGPQALLAKLKAWSRHGGTVRAEALPPLEVSGIRLEPAGRQVVLPGGACVALTGLELRLLHQLMSRPGQALAAEWLAERTWGAAGGGSPRQVQHLVGRLRRKIEPDPRRPGTLCTVRGRGYAFCDG